MRRPVLLVVLLVVWALLVPAHSACGGEAVRLVAPSDGARDRSLSPTLTVEVSHPDGDRQDVRFYGRPAGAGGAGGADGAEEFTVIVLPDTQNYAALYPEIFDAQTRWIANNVDDLNIAFVTHEGDVVDDARDRAQWENADRSLSRLDGVVPYGLLPGDGDQPTTLYNEHFPYTRYDDEPWYGGHHGSRNDNSFQLISASGQDLLFLHVGWEPSDEVLEWADSVLDAHRDRKALITIHRFLRYDGDRLSRDDEIFARLVEANDNVYFVFCGHLTAEVLRTDRVDGRNVHQLLADYQALESGGSGWLRILRFVPADDRVHVETYSPWLDRYQRDDDSEFSLDFPMEDSSGSRTGERIATVRDVRDGARASAVWSDLRPETEYEWWVRVSDEDGDEVEGPIWSFTTREEEPDPPPNAPPVAEDQSVRTVEDEPIEIVLSASDPDGDDLSFAVLEPPGRGTLDGSPPALTYTPEPGFFGEDHFTFSATDGRDQSDPATVRIEVEPAPPPTVHVSPHAAAIGVIDGGARAIAFAASFSIEPAGRGDLVWNGATFESTGGGDASSLVRAARVYLDLNGNGLLDEEDRPLGAERTFDSGGRLALADLATPLSGGAATRFFLIAELGAAVARGEGGGGGGGAGAGGASAGGAGLPGGRVPFAAALATLLALTVLAVLTSRLGGRGRWGRAVRLAAPLGIFFALALASGGGIGGCGGGGGGGGPAAGGGGGDPLPEPVDPGPSAPRDLQISLIGLDVSGDEPAAPVIIEGLPLSASAFEA
jgi:hypothetical protein